jgi:hypothetical protein
LDRSQPFCLRGWDQSRLPLALPLSKTPLRTGQATWSRPLLYEAQDQAQGPGHMPPQPHTKKEPCAVAEERYSDAHLFAAGIQPGALCGTEILIASQATVTELKKTACVASPVRPTAVPTSVKLVYYPYNQHPRYKAYSAPILRYAREVWTATWITEDPCTLRMSDIAHVWRAVTKATRDRTYKAREPITIQSLFDALLFFLGGSHLANHNHPYGRRQQI